MRVSGYYRRGILMTKLHDKLHQIRDDAGKSVASSRYLSLDTLRLRHVSEQIRASSRQLTAVPEPIRELPEVQQIGITLMFSVINYCFVDPDTGVDYVYKDDIGQVRRSSGVMQALIRSNLDWSDFTELSKVLPSQWRKVLQLDRRGVVLYDAEERIRRLHIFAEYMVDSKIDTTRFFVDHTSGQDVYDLLDASGMFDDTFCKRLQVALLWLCDIAADANIPFHLDRSQLTALADYRLPQTMCHLGIVRLGPKAVALLEEKVTSTQLEHDMRSVAIDVCYRISHTAGIDEVDVDTFFWQLSQELLSSHAMTSPAMRVATRSY